MKCFASILTSLAVAGLLVSGCDSPTAPGDSVTPPSFAAANAANTFTNNVKIPVTIGVSIPCAAGGAGEEVFLSGYMHSLFHSTVNGNNFTTKVHTQPQGISGTGLTTGDKYQGTGVTQETLGGSFVNGQFSDTFVNNFRIIGQGRGNNYLVHETFHVTFNASGELTAFVDNFSVECK